MLTLSQLYRQTTGDRKQRATYVRILKTKAGYNKAKQGFVAAQTFSRFKVNDKGEIVRNATPNKYVTLITFLDNKLHVHIACSCSDTCFRWEVANSFKGGAVVEYSNGAAPDTTNPAYKIGMCKHLVALYLKIKPKLPAKH